MGPSGHFYSGVFHDMRLVDFRGLTGSQRTPRVWASQISSNSDTVEICTFFEALSIECHKTGLRDM